MLDNILCDKIFKDSDKINSDQIYSDNIYFIVVGLYLMQWATIDPDVEVHSKTLNLMSFCFSHFSVVRIICSDLTDGPCDHSHSAQRVRHAQQHVYRPCGTSIMK